MKQAIYNRIVSGVALWLFTSALLSAQTVLDYHEAVAEHPDWVQIPGALIRRDCVHEVPKDAKVVIGRGGETTGDDLVFNGRLIAHYDPCPEAPVITRPQGHNIANAESNGPGNSGGYVPGTGNGWVEASQWNVPLRAGDNIDYMGGSWTVPTNPSENGGLIYMFNGIEPASEDRILQPVLQYGFSPAGGGNYWAIASWYVGPNGSGIAYHSPLEIVNPGDTILGYSQMISSSGGNQIWQVLAWDLNTGFSSPLAISISGFRWTWAFAGVLEAYNVTSCNEFPNGILFDGVVLSFLPSIFQNSLVDHGFPKFTSVSPQKWSAAYYWGLNGFPSCPYAVAPGNPSLLFP
jgi:hypothetical protein